MESAENARAQLGGLLRWLAVIGLAYFGVSRLLFLPTFLRVALLDILYVTGIFLIAIVIWRALDLFVDYYRSTLTHDRLN
ncbi:MAG: hypothetical protein R3C44_22535 [Chloroflexota bacterium]